MFKSVKLNLENGNQIHIKAANNNQSNRYISSLSVDGQPYTKNYLTYDNLLKGATIDFNMSATPNRQKGINETDFPYSFSNELKKATPSTKKKK